MSNTYPALHYHKFDGDSLIEGNPVTFSTVLFLVAAQACGVTWEEIPGTRLFRLSYQGETKFFRYQISPNTTDIGFYACLDKATTKNLLRKAGIHVPKGIHIEQQDLVENFKTRLACLQTPLVVKPTHGNKGSEVRINLVNEDEIHLAITQALDFGSDNSEAGVVVEEMFDGEEFRILATKEKIVAAAQRVPANILGDGTQTVEQLIAQKNHERLNSEARRGVYTAIVPDDDMNKVLSEQGLELSSIPKQNQYVSLRKASNVSLGGDSVDVTDKLHESVKTICLEAMNALPGIDFAGIDFMTKDISKPQSSDTYRIIEVNSSPGFDMHEFPLQGQRRFVALELLSLTFPNIKPVIEEKRLLEQENLY